MKNIKHQLLLVTLSFLIFSCIEFKSTLPDEEEFNFYSRIIVASDKTTLTLKKNFLYFTTFDNKLIKCSLDMKDTVMLYNPSYSGEKNRWNLKKCCLSPDGKTLAVIGRNDYSGKYYLFVFDEAKGSQLFAVKTSSCEQILILPDNSQILLYKRIEHPSPYSLKFYFDRILFKDQNYKEFLLDTFSLTSISHDYNYFNVSYDGKYLCKNIPEFYKISDNDKTLKGFWGQCGKLNNECNRMYLCQNHDIEVYNMETRKLISNFPNDNYFNSSFIEISPSEKYFVCLNDRVQVFSAIDGRLLFSAPGNYKASDLKFFDENKFYIHCSNELRLFEIKE